MLLLQNIHSISEEKERKEKPPTEGKVQY